ncbi:unnamed protein product [Ostreobium quekettii]|uniref:Uncharacterized protein n=2 Tax=Ostreobium quekettii TaxID=121088 RepID=A0A8S1ILP2_9CHLO|nr:unnamed protein product [Ostreobium quekettii]
MNFGRPDDKPLEEVIGKGGTCQMDMISRTSSGLAVVVQRLNTTKPVTEKGNQDMRRISRGWSKVQGKLLGNKQRPFFVYPWKTSLWVDFKLLAWMMGFPLAIGLGLVFLSFKDKVLETTPDDHKLYAFVGMPLLGFATGVFVNSWIGFYFSIHMSYLSYAVVITLLPAMSMAVYFALTSLIFPFYNIPICSMLILTGGVFLLSYPHLPYRLKLKKAVRKDLLNALIIMDFLVLVFVVNRLLVMNFGQRDATSLLVLSVLYPILVMRSTTDCARLAEAFNRKTVSVVEAFFTFVSSVFQMIVFLGIEEKVRPLIVFILLNITDFGCLLLSGPLIAFAKKKNIVLLKRHKNSAEDDDFTEGLDVFLRWVKDPLKLKPLLVKTYCEVAAKGSFIILSLAIRFGPSKDTAGFPFIHTVSQSVFNEAVYFTSIELAIWTCLQYTVEIYLRRNRCQYMLQ